MDRKDNSQSAAQQRFLKPFVPLVLALSLFAGLVATPRAAEAAISYNLSYKVPGDSTTATLDGSTVSGDIRLLARPKDNVKRASFFIDDPKRVNKPFLVDTAAPFNADVNTTTLADGNHNATVALLLTTNKTVVISANFTVKNTTTTATSYELQWKTPGEPTTSMLDGATVSGDIRLLARPKDNIAQASFFIDDPKRVNKPFLVDTAAAFNADVDTTALADGNHNATVALLLTTKEIVVLSADFAVKNGTATVEPTPEPVSEPGLVSAPAPENARLGLHITAAELEVWRQRAAHGPYRTKGDESTNSPGDWARIASNASAFLADPAGGRWAGPVANTPGGCVTQVNTEARDTSWVPPYWETTQHRDAAFLALVLDSPEHAATAKTELLAQAKVAGVDFNDRSRWCLGNIGGDQNPMFNISNWLTRLLFTYDYLNAYDANLFSATEKAMLDTWFKGAAEWMQYAVDSKFDELFVNRDAGDYTLTSVAQGSWQDTTYQGGPIVRTLHRRYNNRAAASTRFVGLVGVHQNDASLQATAKQVLKEYVRFAYFPQGAVSDFERWTSDTPDKGWKYSAELTGSLITIADSMARAGDTELYDYRTVEGDLGTAGSLLHQSGEKNLGAMVIDLYRYVDGTYQRYTPAGALIDPAARNFIHDTMLAMANGYYKNDYAKGVYTRHKAPAFPTKPHQSQGDPEGGEWGIYPGALFQFGQTEGIR